MSRRRPPRGAPGLVLSCSLLSMTAAGTTYWAPSLAGRLPLTPGDRAVFTAAIGAGYIACVLPGLAATRLGPRAAALLGSVSLCLTYAGIAVVLHTAPHRPLLYLFPLARKSSALLPPLTAPAAASWIYPPRAFVRLRDGFFLTRSRLMCCSLHFHGELSDLRRGTDGGGGRIQQTEARCGQRNMLRSLRAVVGDAGQF